MDSSDPGGDGVGRVAGRALGEILLGTKGLLRQHTLWQPQEPGMAWGHVLPSPQGKHEKPGVLRPKTMGSFPDTGF